jgi:glycosyltransferase involved in cell wall biosynthesis
MLYQEFSRAGNQVSVLVPGESDHVNPLEEMPGVSLYGVYLRVPFVKETPLKGFVAFCLLFPLTLYALYSFLKREQISVVVLQYPLPQMFYFAILRLLCSWKLIVTLLGNDVHDLPSAGVLDRLMVRLLLKKADNVVGVSRSLLDELKSTFPDLSICDSVIPTGVPLEQFDDSRRRGISCMLPGDYILTVGQLIHRKGIDVLIKALAIAQDQGALMDLVIVGEGEERNSLSSLAQETGLAKHIFFVGNQPHEIALKFYKDCLFFVLASRAEGLPLVIVEAMASGKAVIATKIDGIPEIIHDGYSGILVKPEDPEELAQALMKLYHDSELRDRLGSCGRDSVSTEYTWQVIAQRYLDVFRNRPRSNKPERIGLRTRGITSRP